MFRSLRSLLGGNKKPKCMTNRFLKNAKLNFDTLEDRTVPASAFYVDDLASDYTLVQDNDSDTFVSDGDIVTWNGLTTVTGLVFGTDAFISIQQAIDAASLSGDAVHAAPGTYIGDVDINKSMTLSGARVGVNPNDANWLDTRTVAANESIIHGAVNLSLRNNIVMDGFTVERTDTNEGHILIGSGNPTGLGATSSFNIKNNRFIGTRNTASPGSPWAGIHTNFLNDPASPGAQFVSHQNRIEIAGSASGSGILVNANVPGTDGLGSTRITSTYVANSPGNGFNVNRPGASALVNGNRVVNDDIFTFRANNTVITGNTISNAPQAAISNTGGSTNWEASGNTIITPRAQAFLVGSTFTVDPVTNISITDNTVTVDPSLVGVGVTTVFSPLQYAFIDIRGNMLGTNLVNENSVTLSSNTLNPSVVAVYGLRVRGNVGNLSVTNNTFDGNGVGGPGDATVPPSSGLFVDTDLITSSLDLHVENNFINGWANGASIFDTNTSGPGNFGGLLSGAAVSLFNNDLTSNTMRVQSGAGETVNASGNWWGTADLTAISAGMSGPVDYTPYLNSGADDGGADGFQGDFSSLTVHSDGEQAGLIGRIQEGVALLADGGLTAGARKVNVEAGTYAEQVVITKSLTLQGDGVTTVIRPSSASQLTSIYTTGAQALAFFNGLKLASIIQVSGVGAAGVTIRDLKVDGENVTAVPAGADQVVGILFGETGGVIDAVTVEDMNHVPNTTRTFGMWLDAVGGTPLAVEVNDSTIHLYNRNGLNARGNSLTVDIHDNIITGPGTVGPAQVPNGLLLIAGAGGTITANTISANHYTGVSFLGSGVLLFSARDGIVVSGNDIFDVDDAVLLSGTNSALIQNNDLHDNVKGVRLEAGAANNSIDDNDIDNSNLFGVDVDTAGVGNAFTLNTLTGNATGINIAGGALAIGAGNTIGGGTTGLRVDGASATITGNTLNNLAFSGQSGNYITLANGAMDNLEINGVAATFLGETGATASIAENFDIEDKITHALEANTLGFIRVNAVNVYVTQLSNSIQRGVDAASDGDTVNIEFGTYAGNVDATATGHDIGVTFAAGSSLGQVVIGGDLKLNADDTIAIEIAGAVPETSFDNFFVGGTVALGSPIGANLTVALVSFSPTVGQQFTILNKTSVGAIPDPFAGKSEGATFPVGANTFKITYVGGNGNDVVLTNLGIAPVNTINGTAGNDTLVLTATPGNGSVTYVLNGGTPVDLTGISSFTFNGLDGNDTFNVSLPTTGVLVSGNVAFDGGSGSNTLIFDAGNQSMFVSAGRFTASGGQNTTYVNVNNTFLNNAFLVNTVYGANTNDRATAFNGLTPDQRFVQAMYLSVLRRPGATGELDFWVGVLHSPGGSQASVVNQIETSFEARDNMVKTWYQNYLGRTANGSEQLFWTNSLATQTEEQVLSAILASDEYFSRAQSTFPTGTPIERYVAQVYQSLLNRPASLADIAFWVNEANVKGRASVPAQFLKTTEFRTYLFESYYVTLLHRPSEPAGLAFWVASGTDERSARIGFKSTIEFYLNG